MLCIMFKCIKFNDRLKKISCITYVFRYKEKIVECISILLYVRNSEYLFKIILNIVFKDKLTDQWRGVKKKTFSLIFFQSKIQGGDNYLFLIEDALILTFMNIFYLKFLRDC